MLFGIGLVLFVLAFSEELLSLLSEDDVGGARFLLIFVSLLLFWDELVVWSCLVMECFMAEFNAAVFRSFGVAAEPKS